MSIDGQFSPGGVIRLVTCARVSGETLDLPMTQVVRVRGGRMVAFRPFHWNVPAYRETVRSARS